MAIFYLFAILCLNGVCHPKQVASTLTSGIRMESCMRHGADIIKRQHFKPYKVRRWFCVIGDSDGVYAS